MRFTIAASTLSPAFSAVASVADGRTKPVLANVLVHAERGGQPRLTLSATDMEQSLAATIADASSVSVDVAGDCLLPAARTQQILRECGGEILTFQLHQSGIQVTAGLTAEFELPGEDVSLFPAPVDFEAFARLNGCVYACAAGELRRVLRSTMFAMAAGETARFQFTGLLAEIKGDTLTMVGSDGRRLAKAVCPVTVAAGEPEAKPRKGQTIIPAKALAALSKLLANVDADSDADAATNEVRFSVSSNEVAFSVGGATLHARLVEGRFPDWNSVIPKKPTTAVNFDAGKLYAAVRQAAVMADDETHKVVLTFAAAADGADGGELSLDVKGSMRGRSKVTMATDYKGAGVEVAINPDYLSAFLRTLEAGTGVVAHIADVVTPMVWRVDGDSDYLYLVMPLT